MMRKRHLFGWILLLTLGMSPGIGAAADFRIAVMPFQKLNKEKNGDLDVLSPGISETISGSLSNVRNFIVIDSERVRKYILDEMNYNQQMGFEGNAELEKLRKLSDEKLNADYLIYGSFQLVGKKIKLQAKFIKINEAAAKLSVAVHGNFPDDIFDLQNDLSVKLIQAINGNISTAETKSVNSYNSTTDNFSAYSEYIQGRALQLQYSVNTYPDAIKHYENALKADKNYVLALAGLAEVWALWYYHSIYNGETHKDWIDKAISTGQKAVAEGPGLWQAHKALALAHMMNSNFTDSETSAKKAYEMNANDGELLWILSSIKNYGYKKMTEPGSESNRYIMRAVEVNPDLLIAHWSLAYSYSENGEKEKALEEYKKVVQLNPEHGPAYQSIAIDLYSAGKYAEALPYSDKAIRINPKISKQYYTRSTIYYMLQKYPEAREDLKRALKLEPDYKLAKDLLQRMDNENR